MAKKKKEPCLECQAKILDCQLKVAEAIEREVQSEQKLLSSVSEFENYKKRQQREMDMYKKITMQSILLDFLPLIDEISMAIEAAQDEVAKGLEMTKVSLLKRLEKHGIIAIKVLGKTFDSKYHEALMIMEMEEHEENTIIAVIEEGYMLGEFLLKPAKVVVSKKPSGGGSDEKNS